MLRFSESGAEFEAVSPWVDFMIRLGQEWWREDCHRKIALVSMPCESAAAGLIALGAVIAGLASPTASDKHLHEARLLSFARQYLQFCRDCKVRCFPEKRGCGFSSEANGYIKHSVRRLNCTELDSPTSRIYQISQQTDLGLARLVFERRGVSMAPNKEYLHEWQIRDEPPIRIHDLATPLPKHYYEEFPLGTDILHHNLRESFSGLCLAGRSKGGEDTRAAYESLRFSNRENNIFTLAEALSVDGWSKQAVSRIAFFNTRTKEADRVRKDTRLVVADGHSAFIAVCQRPEYQNAHICGVFNRSSDNDQLENLSASVAELQQWYEIDEQAMLSMPPIPTGISLVILSRRP